MMQTPISFILDLILDHELPPEAQKKCRKYIRELEGSMEQKPQAARAQSVRSVVPEQAMMAPPPPVMPARIVGGEVQTGQGTRGPRKF